MRPNDQEQVGEWLSAYLDGELSDDENRDVEQFVSENEDARRLLEALRSTIDAVAALPRHRAPASLADEIQSHVERSALLGEVGVTQTDTSSWYSPLRAFLSMAAVLVVVVGGWWFISDENGATPIASRHVAPKRESEEQPASKQRFAKSDGSPKGNDELGGAADRVLLASATLEQKERAGLGPRAVRTHAFRNETVRLRFTVDNEKERDRLAQRVASYLRQKKVHGEVPERDTKAEFYYEGASGTNFDDATGRQVLVRAEGSRMNGLLETMEPLQYQGAGVAFDAGPLEVHGWKATRRAVTALASTETADDIAETPRILGGTIKPVEETPVGAFAELMRTISNVAASAPPSGSDAVHKADTDESKNKGSGAMSERYASAESSPQEAMERVPEPATSLGAKGEGSADEATDSVLHDKPSLVSKRKRALQNARRAEQDATKTELWARRPQPTSDRSHRTSHAAMSAKTDDAGPGESLITFVVEIHVKTPTKGGAKSDGGKASGTGSKNTDRS